MKRVVETAMFTAVAALVTTGTALVVILVIKEILSEIGAI